MLQCVCPSRLTRSGFIEASQHSGTEIVRHTLTGETERDGKTTPVKIGVLIVWHKQEGTWKLLARQAVRLPEAATN